MNDKIQKILSARGVTSRRKAEEMIVAGRVSCNGAVCQLGDRADPEVDTILLDGMPIPCDSKRVYIMLNKPRGFVTTLSDEKGRKNAAQLVSDCGRRVYPVGRLDMDSEGLLLFTDDGELANKLMHPSHNINKVYHVLVDGYSEKSLKDLQQPIVLDGYKIRKPDVKVLSVGENGSARLAVTIHEGRNRQVRRMCAAAGMKVKRLKRVAEGDISLGELATGQWRYLTDQEIAALKR